MKLEINKRKDGKFMHAWKLNTSSIINESKKKIKGDFVWITINCGKF